MIVAVVVAVIWMASSDDNDNGSASRPMNIFLAAEAATASMTSIIRRRTMLVVRVGGDGDGSSAAAAVGGYLQGRIFNVFLWLKGFPYLSDRLGFRSIFLWGLHPKGFCIVRKSKNGFRIFSSRHFHHSLFFHRQDFSNSPAWDFVLSDRQ